MSLSIHKIQTNEYIYTAGSFFYIYFLLDSVILRTNYLLRVRIYLCHRNERNTLQRISFMRLSCLCFCFNFPSFSGDVSRMNEESAWLDREERFFSFFFWKKKGWSTASSPTATHYSAGSTFSFFSFWGKSTATALNSNKMETKLIAPAVFVIRQFELYVNSQHWCYNV